jgi:hypothetical protein
VWVLEIEKMNWIKPKLKGIIPKGRRGHSADLITENFSNKIIIFGGVYNNKMLNEIFELDISKN